MVTRLAVLIPRNTHVLQAAIPLSPAAMSCICCRPEADEDESDAEVNQRRLRMYERSKLRYYFAVVECDTVSTASNLYAQCDGLEFELTANRSAPAASASAPVSPAPTLANAAYH